MAVETIEAETKKKSKSKVTYTNSRAFERKEFPRIVDQLFKSELIAIRSGKFLGGSYFSLLRFELGHQILEYINEKGDRPLEDIPSVIVFQRDHSGGLIFVRESNHPDRRLRRVPRAYQ